MRLLTAIDDETSVQLETERFTEVSSLLKEIATVMASEFGGFPQHNVKILRSVRSTFSIKLELIVIVVCSYVQLCVCKCVYMYMYIYIYMCICMYTMRMHVS